MEAMIEVLEHELEEAFEVKNKQSLHRYVILLTENIVKKDNYEKEQLRISSETQKLTEIVKQGFMRMDERFAAVDKRFELMQTNMDERFEAVDKHFELMQTNMDERFAAVDKRFEDMNRKFSMMFVFMNLGMSILVIITILFKFLD